MSLAKNWPGAFLCFAAFHWSSSSSWFILHASVPSRPSRVAHDDKSIAPFSTGFDDYFYDAHNNRRLFEHDGSSHRHHSFHPVPSACLCDDLSPFNSSHEISQGTCSSLLCSIKTVTSSQVAAVEDSSKYFLWANSFLSHRVNWHHYKWRCHSSLYQYIILSSVDLWFRRHSFITKGFLVFMGIDVQIFSHHPVVPEIFA